MIYAWMFNADCFVFKCREMLKVNRSVNLPICPNNLVLVSVYMYNQMSLTSSRLKTRSLSAIKKQQHRQGTQLKGEGRKTQKNTAAKLPRTIGSSSTVGWQINRAVKPNRVYCCCHCCFGSCQTDTLLIKPDFENWTGCLWLWLKKKSQLKFDVQFEGVTTPWKGNSDRTRKGLGQWGRAASDTDKTWNKI